MKFHPLDIEGCYRIELAMRGDERGQFARTFCAEEFAEQGLVTQWVQCNMSITRRKGTVRGMHFQRPPADEVKMIRCVRGAVLDVMVDLRAGSPTYGRWTSVELSADKRNMAYLAAGCAHGFQTLTDDVELCYFHSRPYRPDLEGGVHHADDDLAIDWPLPVGCVSERDAALPPLKEVEPIA